MVRTPCCEKMGLKKGPWSSEEDRILISYIQKHGHGNWRALPKLAGLLRCGKSCRLRWTNYLRPDIKRGNFSREEEETIIELHEMLGNRWSAIAAKLPGRTDNEIKNVWHTHLKKRVLKQKQDSNSQQYASESESANPIDQTFPVLTECTRNAPTSPQPSSTKQSSVTGPSVTPAETNNAGIINGSESMESLEMFPVIDEDFWSEPELVENCCAQSNFLDELHFQFPFTDALDGTSIDDGVEFWYDIFVKAGGMQVLP